MANISGGYWSPYSSPTSYYQISYSEIARNGSSATYRFSIGVNLGSSSSTFGYPLTGHLSVNGASTSWSMKGTEKWSGTGVHWFTIDITCSAGSGGGTLGASFWTTRDSYPGNAMIISVSGTVNLSTWNTAPYWPSGAACTVSPNGIIAENIASLTVSWTASVDTEGNTRYYTVRRYKNGNLDSTIATNTTTTSVTDNIGPGNQGSQYYYTVEVNDGSLTQGTKLQSATVTKNTFTGPTLAARGSITYSSTALAMTISGAKNTNGNTSFTYSLACDKVTVYNPTASPSNITIYKSGALPSGTYIKFDDIKAALVSAGYKGNFKFTLTTTNAYGSTKTAEVPVYVDITANPNAIGNITVSGTFAIGGQNYFVPGKKDITVAWGASSDPLGGSITYELQGKVGYDNFVTLATGITGVTKTVSLAAVTAQTTYVFRVIAKTSYGTSVSKDAAAIDLHYYYTPSVIFDPVIRNINDAIISGEIKLNTSILGVSVSSLTYSGKTSGNLTLATTFTKQETGLLETDTFNFTVTVRDSAGDVINGLTGVSFSKSVPRYTPMLSVRKKGIGINALADDTYKFVVGAKSKFLANTMTALGSQRIYNNVAEFLSTTSSVTGTLKITLPKSWSSTMMNLTIKGYNYNSVGAWMMQLGGYNYNHSTSPNWVNTSATIIGSAPSNVVRFGHDGSRCCILLGVTSTVWSYPKLIMEQFIATFANIDGWDNGWGFEFITDEIGISNIVAPAINSGWFAPSFIGSPLIDNNGWLKLRGADTGDKIVEFVNEANTRLGYFGRIASGATDYITMFNAKAGKGIYITDSGKLMYHNYDVGLATSANITYYVRTDGNDNNSGTGDSSTGAFRTVNKALSMIPPIVNHDIIIYVRAGTYNEHVKFGGATGIGSIQILGDLSGSTPLVKCGNHALYDGAKDFGMYISVGTAYCNGLFRDVGVPFRIVGIDFTSPTVVNNAYQICVRAMNCPMIVFERCILGVFPTGNSCRGISISWGSVAYLWECTFTGNPYHSVYCEHSSQLYANTMKGSSRVGYAVGGGSTVICYYNQISTSISLSETPSFGGGWFYVGD